MNTKTDVISKTGNIKRPDYEAVEESEEDYEGKCLVKVSIEHSEVTKCYFSYFIES